MLVEELRIEGFRSLKSVTWKPGRLNVLIGPNGGGKSNLLRALDLLRVAATRGGLRDAILRMGGMAPLVWDGEARKIRFGLTAATELQPSAVSYHLSLARLGTSGGFQIQGEELSLKHGHSSFAPVDPDTETLLSQLDADDGPAAVSFKRDLQSWSIHNDMRVDQDAELRRAAVTRSERRVEPEGQNLIAVLHTLYENDRQFEEFLDKAMGAAFPDDYNKLSFPPAEDGRTQLRARRKHRKRADSAADLSDGTLRFLLLLAILGSPDAAPLIAIDEPETGLHPRMFPIIAEIAANAAVKTQVILTTHSPKLLDAFGEDLPATTVVTWNGSESELKTIGGDELKRWVENYSLGKFAFSGEAEAVL
jgi:predicted ATPase